MSFIKKMVSICSVLMVVGLFSASVSAASLGNICSDLPASTAALCVWG